MDRQVIRQKIQLIKAVLREWDPIGVYEPALSPDEDDPWPDDEYNSYAPRVHALLDSGATSKEVCAWLSEVRTSSMALPKNDEADMRIAEKLVAWFSTER
jgi:hypothetical protein